MTYAECRRRRYRAVFTRKLHLHDFRVLETEYCSMMFPVPGGTWIWRAR